MSITESQNDAVMVAGNSDCLHFRQILPVNRWDSHGNRPNNKK